MAFEAHRDFSVAGDEAAMRLEDRDRFVGQRGTVVLEVNRAVGECALGLRKPFGGAHRPIVGDRGDTRIVATVDSGRRGTTVGAVADCRTALLHLIVRRRAVFEDFFLRGRAGTQENCQKRGREPGPGIDYWFHLLTAPFLLSSCF